MAGGAQPPRGAERTRSLFAAGPDESLRRWANVVTEAIAAGVPVISTRIDGSIGILGDDYPGYYPVGDVSGLAALLRRCEDEPAFLADLRARVLALQPLVDPARERTSWRELVQELAISPTRHARR